MLMIENTGGTFIPPTNLRRKESLYWVLETIQHPVVFNEDRYPTIFHKAALLAWTIITRHVFVDGNKRAAMAGAQVFLLINNYFLNVSNGEIEEMALKIVAHREEGFTEEGFREWMEAKSVYFTEVEDI